MTNPANAVRAVRERLHSGHGGVGRARVHSGLARVPAPGNQATAATSTTVAMQPGRSGAQVAELRGDFSITIVHCMNFLTPPVRLAR